MSSSAHQGKEEDGKDGRREEKGGGRKGLGQSWKSLPPNTGPGTKYNSAIVCWTIMKFSGKGWVKTVSQKMKQELEIEGKGTGICP